MFDIILEVDWEALFPLFITSDAPFNKEDLPPPPRLALVLKSVFYGLVYGENLTLVPF